MQPKDTLNIGHHISASEAEQAIQTIRKVLDRLGQRQGTGRLQGHLHFAQEALWAAAFPDDPNSMLTQVAADAEDAVG